MMSNTASLKKEYAERIAPALKNQFQYTSTMQIPKLKKIVINQGLGMAVADKKIIDVAINELTAITGQKAVATVSRKDIANFKLRKKMPIGVMVTLRRERMYEFLEKLVKVDPSGRSGPRPQAPSRQRQPATGIRVPLLRPDLITRRN